MKNLEVKAYSTRESLIFSILFFVFGVILFTNPNGVIKIVTYIFSGILILMGLFRIFSSRKKAKDNSGGSVMDLVSGFIFISLGIVMCIFFSLIETAIRFVFGAYILYVGINRLIFALTLFKGKEEHPIVAIVISALMVLFGILLALIPGLSISIIGLFIMGYAAMEMIGFIFYSQRKEKENSVKEATIIKEETIVKEEKIEEAKLIEENTKKKKNVE